jgi:hypothetical protein
VRGIATNGEERTPPVARRQRDPVGERRLPRPPPCARSRSSRSRSRPASPHPPRDTGRSPSDPARGTVCDLRRALPSDVVAGRSLRPVDCLRIGIRQSGAFLLLWILAGGGGVRLTMTETASIRRCLVCETVRAGRTAEVGSLATTALNILQACAAGSRRLSMHGGE